MWEKSEKKTIFTLCVDNYAPEITELTFPLLHRLAKKIGADFHIIKERRFPDFPPVYEKLQIYQLAQEMQNDWNWFIDADALVNPEIPDVTTLISKNTVLHNGNDFAGIRWKYDRYFKRYGKHIGSCNWFTIGSDWCIELWKPLEDLTFAEAVANISLTREEMNCGVMEPSHLIDDYTLSRNIAMYGLDFTTFEEIQRKLNFGGFYLWHQYTMPKEKKIIEMKKVLSAWRLI
jgi:hypothetical protein